MVRSFNFAALLATSLLFSAPCLADDDELVRLPGQGEVRNEAARELTRAERLKPAGGLFLSFDENGDGLITLEEIRTGIPLAFSEADANEDGFLTALEQQAWADNLPTRDDSLANPVRFDPNLDKRVDPSEFALVISDLGAEYADEVSGDIVAADLKAPPPERKRRGPNLLDGEWGARGGPEQTRN